ncbi:hypothetical protein [Cutibacterium sp.]|nr:hypothetical protein [Cutibacterium sp.]MDO4413172.1 hypothetical protein [Cutibacterium sp.]
MGVERGGDTGYESSAAEEVRETVAGVDLFHVVRLAGEDLDRCRV